MLDLLPRVTSTRSRCCRSRAAARRRTARSGRRRSTSASTGVGSPCSMPACSAVLGLRLDGDHAHALADRRLDPADRDRRRRPARSPRRRRARPPRSRARRCRRRRSRADRRTGWTSVRPVSVCSCVEALERVGRVGRLEVDGRAVAARRLDLLRGRALPHDDECVDALGCARRTRPPGRGCRR